MQKASSAASSKDGHSRPQEAGMERRLFRYIWQHSSREQIFIALIVIASIPTYFLSLQLPKLIINGPISEVSHDYADGPARFLEITIPAIGWLGTEAVTLFNGVALAQIPHLVALCAALFVLVCINGGFKYFINTFKGQLGERMLRRLRYQLIDRTLRFPQSYLRRLKPAEVSTMVNNEVEPLGGFIGDAYATPLFLLAQALTALAFLMLQNIWLGSIALVLVLIQTGIIPRLRRRLVMLGKMRQIAARAFAGRVGEIMEGAREIRVNGAADWEKADISDRLGTIYGIRFRLYRAKFFIKFLNNLLAQVTPMLFYLAGGYAVIRGDLDIGQLVAVIAAYRDLPPPIKELINWDQQRVDVQVKYAMIVDQFSPPDMPAPRDVPAVPVPLGGSVTITNATFGETADEAVLRDLTLTQKPRGRVMVLSDNPRASEMLAEALARLVPPLRGKVEVGSRDLTVLDDITGGKRIAYVGPGVYYARSTLRDALLYGLRHPPAEAIPAADDDFDVAEARRSGNLTLSPRLDWLAADPDAETLDDRLLDILRLTGLYEDAFELGLSTRIDPETRPDLANSVVQARAVLRFWIEEQVHDDLVEPFDETRYTTEDSIAANLVFGAAQTESAREDFLLTLPAQNVLRASGVADALIDIGAGVAATLLELIGAAGEDDTILRDVPLLDLSETDAIAALGPTLASWRNTADGQAMLMRFALRYVEPRDRLGLLDTAMQDRFLAARHALLEARREEIAALFSLYEIDDYTPGATILDNILFGKVRIEAANGRQRIRKIILDMLDGLEMNDAIALAGLSTDIGNGGRSLSEAQRQRLALARALLKRPDILVLNRPFDVLGEDAERALLADVLARLDAADMPETTVVAALSRPALAPLFQRVVTLKDGILSEDRTAPSPS